jgi:hypothetical protein
VNFYCFAQTTAEDIFANIDPGPLFLIAAAGLSVLTSGLALQRTLLLLLNQPLEKRDQRILYFPYLGIFAGAVIGIGSVPQIFTISGIITYPIAFIFGLFVAVSIWQQFIQKVLEVPTERLFRRQNQENSQ